MKTRYLIIPAVIFLLILSFAAIPAFGAPVPHSKVRDHATGVTLEVYGSRYVAAGANAEFLMIYVTNPSSDYSVSQTSFVNIFGTSQTEYVPADNVVILNVTTNQYNATTPATPVDCYPPSTSGGSLDPGYCLIPSTYTHWQYRFAMHGWGESAVAPGETTLVYFQGWTVGANSHHYSSDVTVAFTYEGASYSLTTTISYSGF